MTSIAQASGGVIAEPKIVHEAIDDRQHVRARLPGKVKLFGRTGEITCDLYDLSLGGVGVITQAPLKEGMIFKGNIIIPMANADLQVAVDLKVNKVRSEIVGLGFMDISPGKRDMLRHIMSSYLSGDIVDVDGVLNVMQRENYIKQRKDKAASVRAWSERIKSIVGTLMYFIVGVSILAFLAYKVYLYLFQITTTNAFVTADIYNVSMPDNGYVNFLLPPDQSRVAKGEPIAVVSSQLSSSITTPADVKALLDLSDADASALLGRTMIETVINSPCDCDLVYVQGFDSRYDYKGATLIDLIPVDKPMYIKATIPSQRLSDIQRAKTATVSVYGADTEYGAQVVSARYSQDQEALELRLMTEEPLTTESYKAPVRVSLIKDLSF